MSSRRDFLVHLFCLLDERQIPYCVLRNHNQVFDDAGSDVDLLTAEGRVEDLVAACSLAGKATNYVQVQRTRFVNHSLVFWDGGAAEENFVRIDVDTEIRWRHFHVLTAEEVLSSRRRFESFYVPDAAHEAVIVLTQAMWQGKLSERYARRLGELRPQLTDENVSRRQFDAAFGLPDNLLADLNNSGPIARIRNATRRSCFLRPTKGLCSLGHALTDLRRLFVRRNSPPGLFVRLIGAKKTFAEELCVRLSVLFPTSKNLITEGRMSHDAHRETLFKGGLAVEILPDVPKPASFLRHDWPKPDRSFGVVCDAAGNAEFIHIGTGFPQSSEATAERLANYICIRLAYPPITGNPPRRGAFAVLLGLDGAGKTTLALNLTSELAGENIFQGVRYFHWLPGLLDTFEFPLPEPSNQPRKRKLAAGFVQSGLSVLRLTKNLVRAHLAWWMRLRPLRNSGYLVLVDRYFYNYYLDPVSVKYYGPRWVLDVLTRLFPKPEIVITLSAPPEILLRRKQELSEAEMREQSEVLKQLQFTTPHVIAADASEPAAQVAEKVMHRLREILS